MESIFCLIALDEIFMIKNTFDVDLFVYLVKGIENTIQSFPKSYKSQAKDLATVREIVSCTGNNRLSIDGKSLHFIHYNIC